MRGNATMNSAPMTKNASLPLDCSPSERITLVSSHDPTAAGPGWRGQSRVHPAESLRYIKQTSRHGPIHPLSAEDR
jgi:hypothetical protein